MALLDRPDRHTYAGRPGGLEGDHGDPAHGEGRKDSRRCRFQQPPRTILVFFGGFLVLGLFFVEFQS